VAHVSAELAPVAKVGGLGDVVAGLVRAGRKPGGNAHSGLADRPTSRLLTPLAAARPRHTQAKECAARGAEVEVVLPFYECIPPEAVDDLTLEFEFSCPSGAPGRDGAGFEPRSVKTQAWAGRVDGVRVLLLRPDWAAPGGGGGLFRGARVYGGGYPEVQAYLYFCRAALEALARSGRRPDVVHAHEWQCAAVPVRGW
jgi:starch synthase